MKTRFIHTALTAVLALAGANALAGASVTFVHPESYADLPTDVRDREQVLKDLQKHFDHLAASLPPGQDLKVEVLELDLAGRLIPTHTLNELRVLRGGADWPHMRLRYTLESGGQVVRQGDVHLKNMDYLNRLNRYFSDDSLRYEKQMIDDWFRSEIAPAR